ncbi:MAG: hypothetical protein NTX57_11910 [Armatimonadetes bacterium]|nr:hypothetical protein [Armatimonadota bacterium]
MEEIEGLKEIVVFFSYENQERPRQLAEAMLKALQLPYLALGVDALTSGCELRLYYHKETLASVRTYLDRHKILHDITYL